MTPVCIEVLPNHCQLIMVAERKGVDRLDIQNQHARTRPPPVLPQRGTRRFYACREYSEE